MEKNKTLSVKLNTKWQSEYIIDVTINGELIGGEFGGSNFSRDGGEFDELPPINNILYTFSRILLKAGYDRVEIDNYIKGIRY